MARAPSTPAISAAERAAIAYTVHTYATESSTDAAGWGVDAARALGVPPARVFKTLVVALDGGRLAVAIIPVACRLRLKAVAAAFGVREAAMADARAAERATGYVVGGISPLGQRRALPTALDASAFDAPTLHVSAGRRGLEIELSADDLARLTGAIVAELTA